MRQPRIKRIKANEDLRKMFGLTLREKKEIDTIIAKSGTPIKGKKLTTVCLRLCREINYLKKSVECLQEIQSLAVQRDFNATFTWLHSTINILNAKINRAMRELERTLGGICATKQYP